MLRNVVPTGLETPAKCERRLASCHRDRGDAHTIGNVGPQSEPPGAGQPLQRLVESVRQRLFVQPDPLETQARDLVATLCELAQRRRLRVDTDDIAQPIRPADDDGGPVACQLPSGEHDVVDAVAGHVDHPSGREFACVHEEPGPMAMGHRSKLRQRQYLTGGRGDARNDQHSRRPDGELAVQGGKGGGEIHLRGNDPVAGVAPGPTVSETGRQVEHHGLSWCRVDHLPHRVIRIGGEHDDVTGTGVDELGQNRVRVARGGHGRARFLSEREVRTGGRSGSALHVNNDVAGIIAVSNKTPGECYSALVEPISDLSR